MDIARGDVLRRACCVGCIHAGLVRLCIVPGAELQLLHTRQLQIACAAAHPPPCPPPWLPCRSRSLLTPHALAAGAARRDGAALQLCRPASGCAGCSELLVGCGGSLPQHGKQVPSLAADLCCPPTPAAHHHPPIRCRRHHAAAAQCGPAGAAGGKRGCIPVCAAAGPHQVLAAGARVPSGPAGLAGGEVHARPTLCTVSIRTHEKRPALCCLPHLRTCATPC